MFENEILDLWESYRLYGNGSSFQNFRSICKALFDKGLEQGFDLALYLEKHHEVKYQ